MIFGWCGPRTSAGPTQTQLGRCRHATPALGPCQPGTRPLRSAPEVPHGDKPGQPFGEEARDYLDHLIGGKTVRVDSDGPDQYRQVLGVLWGGQINVNLLLGALGDAEVYRGAACQVHCQELEEAEIRASRDRVGMWVQGPNYESPRTFRQRLKIRGG